MKKASANPDPVRTYLDSLTKEELIDFILTFAPPSFLETVKGRLASQQEAVAMFRRIAHDIDVILADEELLYDPSGFERELLQQLERLRGLWEKVPVEIGELILSLMKEVEQAFEDGYLYLEKYGEADEYFESEDVNTYIVQFVKALPHHIRREYLEQLEEVLNEAGYSTFMSVGQQLF
jgi:hypothetical protein